MWLWMGVMKELRRPDTEIVIEWTGVGANGAVAPGRDQLRRLASVLGKIAARRELARLRKGEAVSLPIFGLEDQQELE
jgi:hypothetical protein